MTIGYVVYGCERKKLDHGEDVREWSRVFDGLGPALDYLSLHELNDKTRLRLFELGSEIPLRIEETEIPQPSVKAKKFVVAE